MRPRSPPSPPGRPGARSRHRALGPPDERCPGWRARTGSASAAGSRRRHDQRPPAGGRPLDQVPLRDGHRRDGRGPGRPPHPVRAHPTAGRLPRLRLPVRRRPGGDVQRPPLGPALDGGGRPSAAHPHGVGNPQQQDADQQLRQLGTAGGAPGQRSSTTSSLDRPDHNHRQGSGATPLLGAGKLSPPTPGIPDNTTVDTIPSTGSPRSWRNKAASSSRRPVSRR